MIFKPCVGFPGYYVSDTGEVRSKRRAGAVREHVWAQLATKVLKGGYHHVKLFDGHGGYVMRLVQRLVLQAFVGPCPPGMEARHIDGNPANNCLDNLAWSTHADNEADKRRHGTLARGSRVGSAKLTESDIPQIRRMIAQGHKQTLIAKFFGVAPTSICGIHKGRAWMHVS